MNSSPKNSVREKLRALIVSLVIAATVVFTASACGGTVIPSPTPTAVLSPTPRPTPTPPPVRGWDGVTVRSLCLEVQESYPQLGDTRTTPIRGAIVAILHRAGFETVEGVNEQCEASLTVTVTGRASGLCFRGGTVSGQIALASPGRAPLSVPIESTSPDPSVVREDMCHNKPELTLNNLAPRALVPGLNHLWGPSVVVQALAYAPNHPIYLAGEMELERIGLEALPVLIEALADRDEKVRRGAAELLGDLGPKASEAVPGLIQALGDEDGYVRGAALDALQSIGPKAADAIPGLIHMLEGAEGWRAAEALTAITGQDLGADAAAWQEWWEEKQQ